MKIHPAVGIDDIVSGMTMVDVSEFPWPGYTFGQTPSCPQEQVEGSYQALASALSVSRDAIVTATQVHGCDVLVVGQQRPDSTVQADALVTNHPSWVLGVKLADCCGVVMFDPVHRAVAAVHSGWRGTASNVVGAAIATMQKEYATNPRDLRVWLSPCASGSVYEVRADVVAELPAYCTPRNEQSDCWTFDNHAAIRHQLCNAGVPSSSIVVDAACTISEPRWHSHRRDREAAGRMLAFIGLRPMARK